MTDTLTGTSPLRLRQEGEDWTALLDRALLPAVEEHGYVLARGFEIDTERFDRIVRSSSSALTLDPARVFHGSAAQLVDSGHHDMGLHLENGATPYAPDLLWFCCLKAASSGSQTTICDGQRAYAEMDPEVRDAFARTPIRYERRVDAQMWRRLAAFMSGRSDPAQATVTDLYEQCRPGAQVEIELLDDDSVRYVFDVRVVDRTRWSATPAWASSLLGPSYNYEPPTITFADGAPIPQEYVAECERATAAVTEEIAWQNGDLVLIDNSRVMHGRRAITDPDRTILNAQSML